MSVYKTPFDVAKKTGAELKVNDWIFPTQVRWEQINTAYPKDDGEIVVFTDQKDAEYYLNPDKYFEVSSEPPNDGLAYMVYPGMRIAYAGKWCPIAARFFLDNGLIEFQVALESGDTDSVTYRDYAQMYYLPPSVRSPEEIEALKKQWRNDPIWDIEETPGFEAHSVELYKYRQEIEAEGFKRDETITKNFAKAWGFPENIELAKLLRFILEKISELTQEIELLKGGSHE